MSNGWKPNVCIYHGDCNDGFGAAWAVWKRWGDAVQYVPAHYGKQIDAQLDGKHLLFVDFSLKRIALNDLLDRTPPQSIIVLDHHATAEAELEPFIIRGCGAKGYVTGLLNDLPGILRDFEELGRPAIISVFDMAKSGARLAWEFCHPGVALPNLLAHVEDRDLWRFALPGTKEIHAGLSSYSQDFNEWSELADGSLTTLWAEGAAILRMQDKRVAELCDMAEWEAIAGHTAPCVNAPFFMASDIGHELLRRHPDAPFAATWYCTADSKHFSLRSTDDRQDVSAIAASFGGGGHRNAAGFNYVNRGVKFAID